MVRRIAVETREDWLAARRTGIASSDVAPILGASPYRRGILDVYADKLGLTPEGADEPTEAMEIGLLMQPVVGELVRRRFPDRRVGDPQNGLFRSLDLPILLATPDFWVEDPVLGPGLLETKWHGSYAAASEWQEGPPLHVLLQVQHQMFCLRAQWAQVAAIIGSRFVTCDVLRNEEFLKEWIYRAGIFWAHVERREPPPADGPSLEILKRLYPDVAKRTQVDLPAEAMSWHLSLCEAESEAKRWKGVRDDAEAQIRQAMGEAEVGILPGGRVHYIRNPRSRKGHWVKDSTWVELRRKELR